MIPEDQLYPNQDSTTVYARKYTLCLCMQSEERTFDVNAIW